MFSESKMEFTQPLPSQELLNGGFEAHHLLVDKEALEAARPLLQRLGVAFKESMYTPETHLDTGSPTSMSPAGFRIEVMDPSDQSKAAEEDLVAHTYTVLREAGIQVERVKPLE